MFSPTLLQPHAHLITSHGNAKKGMSHVLQAGLFSLLCLMTPYTVGEEMQRGPDVVIIASEDKVVYEFRQNGELRMVRIVPKWGKPYYLVPRDNTKGFGNLERADMLLPQWVIAEF